MTIVTRFEQNPNGTTPEKMNCKAILKYPMHGRTPDMIATLSYVAAETSARKTTFTYIQAKNNRKRNCFQQLSLILHKLCMFL